MCTNSYHAHTYTFTHTDTHTFITLNSSGANTFALNDVGTNDKKSLKSNQLVQKGNLKLHLSLLFLIGEGISIVVAAQPFDEKF